MSRPRLSQASSTGLPQWRQSRVGSLSGTNHLIPTRFIFEKIESTHSSSSSNNNNNNQHSDTGGTGYDVRESSESGSHNNKPSSTVVYRSTFQIFVSADDPDYAAPEGLDGIAVLGRRGIKLNIMGHEDDEGGEGESSRSICARLQACLDRSKRSVLHKHNTLPDDPTLPQRIWYLLLCPPHGPCAVFLTKILIGLLVWLTLLSLLKEDALPGGNVFALVILIGAAFVGGFLISLIRLPPLLGMLIVGFMLRNVPGINIAGDIDPKWSSVLRNIALTVILIRAGLGLDGPALKKLSKSVLLLSFLPCLAEAASVGLASHFILGFPWLWAFLLGFVQGAVSPAVLVPFMLNLQETRLGTKQGIPTLLIAASSLDDVLAISGFSVLLSVIFSQGAALWFNILQGPLEMLMGLTYGIFIGFIFWYLPHRRHDDLSTLRFLFLLCGGLVGVFGSKALGFSGAGALGALTAAFVAGHRWRAPGWDHEMVKAAQVFAYLWTFCQPVLFGLIGAEVVLANVHMETVGLALAVMFVTILVRMAVTVLAVSFAGLTLKERLFVAIAWLPKATVQAALGSLALDAAREIKAAPDIILLGEKVVTIAVLLILITAPVGAVAIAFSAPRLLQKDDSDVSVKPDANKISKDERSLEMLERNPKTAETVKMIDVAD
ncbi:Mitochondrial sodium/hydrogen exchanger 9B2 [Hypsibius exemplaris]|uniref:Mitochondrial sodium/hydrogen exchanger 9B2 n=1 Tax=Hypsibius exemplaris TaxID=2072580 RepID=A0A1W0X2J9_HYPEX|nr:Mitochondrial sodium/hydrogen exchanger 9B2 [Hypsibius exemplaris]